MNELHLKGLVAHRPATLLSTFGLFHILPGCRIRFNRSKNRWHPVVTTEFTVEEVVNQIFNSIENLIPDGYGYGVSNLTFDSFQKIPIETALAFGCDHFLLQKKNETIVGKHPLRFLARATTLRKEFDKIKDCLYSQPKELQSQLLLDSKYWSKGLVTVNSDNFMFFPEGEKQGAYRIRHQIVPIFNVLSIASWYVLKCYGAGGITTCPGYDFENKKFQFPLMGRSLTVEEYTSWIIRPDLLEYHKHRAAFKRLGVLEVFYFERRSGINGSDSLGPCHLLRS